MLCEFLRNKINKLKQVNNFLKKQVPTGTPLKTLESPRYLPYYMKAKVKFMSKLSTECYTTDLKGVMSN